VDNRPDSFYLGQKLVRLPVDKIVDK
jgi:hypothetical protein